jgi:hypothetical protein
MKTYKIKVLFMAICTSLLFVQCIDDDDNGNVINEATCDDGIQNGDEIAIDCGGTCEPCEGALDFSGNYSQEDSMGRPGVNTLFSGSDAIKNLYNRVPPSMRADLQAEEGQTATFQATFQNLLETYHDVYAVALGLDPVLVNYEANILALDAAQFTALLANFDALQVAPNGQTVYYDAATGVALTGRGLEDDVIDVSLTLMFGGADGVRFNGENETPQLTSDGVSIGTRTYSDFPYLEAPILIN